MFYCFLTFILGNWLNVSSSPDLFYKKMFFTILQKSQENTCDRVFFPAKLQVRGLQGSGSAIFIWILQSFKSMYFAEHLRTAASPISCLLGCLKDGRKMKGPSFVNFMVFLLPLFWFIVYFFPNALWRFLLKKLLPTLTPDNFAIPQKIL